MEPINFGDFFRDNRGRKRNPIGPPRVTLISEVSEGAQSKDIILEAQRRFDSFNREERLAFERDIKDGKVDEKLREVYDRWLIEKKHDEWVNDQPFRRR